MITRFDRAFKACGTKFNIVVYQYPGRQMNGETLLHLQAEKGGMRVARLEGYELVA
jgi:hypothetical protein